MKKEEKNKGVQQRYSFVGFYFILFLHTKFEKYDPVTEQPSLVKFV